MTKNLVLTYTTRATGFEKGPGKAYANPSFFSSPRSGVAKVILEGPWPIVEAAYTALGVPVETADGALPLPTGADDVDIPADWEALHWSRPNGAGLSMRALATKVSPTPVLNGEQARAAIKAEQDRREKAAG